MVVSNIFDAHPYFGKISNLTSIFFRWVGSTTNQLYSFRDTPFQLIFSQVSDFFGEFGVVEVGEVVNDNHVMMIRRWKEMTIIPQTSESTARK